MSAEFVSQSDRRRIEALIEAAGNRCDVAAVVRVLVEDNLRHLIDHGQSRAGAGLGQIIGRAAHLTRRAG